MPPKKKDDKDITVEALLSVSDDEGTRTVVRRFDVAWHLALKLAVDGHPKPIRVHFEQWIRKED